MSKLARFILKIAGWKVTGIKDYPNKCVLCVAPHTSNWDFPLGKLAYASLDRKASFLIKKTWFTFPLNLIMGPIGGFPVDKAKSTALTIQLTKEFARRTQFELAITPEGTRKKNTRWKRGFYHIAMDAKVPIVIVLFDYGNKEVRFKKVFTPTGNIEEDLIEIKKYYEGVKAKFPAKFSTGM